MDLQEILEICSSENESNQQFSEKSKKISDGSTRKTQDFATVMTLKLRRIRREHFYGCSNQVWGFFDSLHLQPSSVKLEFWTISKVLHWFLLRGHNEVVRRWRHRREIWFKNLEIIKNRTHPLHLQIRMSIFLSFSW